MRKVLLAILFIGTWAMMGCQPPDAGLNTQRAGLHGAGQVSAAFMFDNRPKTEVPEDIKKTVEIVKEIRKFLQTGHVADLTMGELRAELDKLIPPKYTAYFNAILAAVSNINVPTDKIGPDNLKRINEVLDGIQMRAEKYDINDHPPEAKAFGNVFEGDHEVEVEYNVKRKLVRIGKDRR